jgi:hypothetical protein
MNLTGFKFFKKTKLYLTQILNKKFLKKNKKQSLKKEPRHTRAYERNGSCAWALKDQMTYFFKKMQTMCRS